MKLFNHLSLQRRLMLVIMLTSTVALLSASIAFIGFHVRSFRQQMISDLSTLAQVLSDNSTAILSFGRPDEATELLASLANKSGVNAAAMYDASGALFARYQRDKSTAFVPSVLRTILSRLTTFSGQSGKERGVSLPLLVRNKLRGINNLMESLPLLPHLETRETPWGF